MNNIQGEVVRYLNQHASRSHHTARTYRYALNRFTSYLRQCDVDPEGPVNQLTIGLARDFVTWLAARRYRRQGEEKQLSMRSRQLYAHAISGFYKMLILDGGLDIPYGKYAALHEYMVRATNYDDAPIEKKLPPDDVIAAVIAAIETPPEIGDRSPPVQRRLRLVWLRDRAVLLCLYTTGMRIGELVGLRRNDLDHADRGAWVNGKGSRERFVRFSREAWAALMGYLDERHADEEPTDAPLFCRHDQGAGRLLLPLTTLTVHKTITTLARTTGAGERFNLTAHSFRHHFATRFLRHTKDLALTQDVMGHASPQTTRIYAKTTKEDHIAAHKSLFDAGSDGGLRNN